MTTLVLLDKLYFSRFITLTGIDTTRLGMGTGSGRAIIAVSLYFDRPIAVYRIRENAHTSTYSVKNALFSIPVHTMKLLSFFFFFFFFFCNIVSASLTPASTVRGWFVAVAPNHGMRNG